MSINHRGLAMGEWTEGVNLRRLAVDMAQISKEERAVGLFDTLHRRRV